MSTLSNKCSSEQLSLVSNIGYSVDSPTRHLFITRSLQLTAYFDSLTNKPPLVQLWFSTNQRACGVSIKSNAKLTEYILLATREGYKKTIYSNKSVSFLVNLA